MLNSAMVQYLSSSEVNNMFPIKSTQYNRNCRYSDRVKLTWKKMYDELGYQPATIAMIWNCPVKTVRMVVDTEYRDRCNEARKTYNKKYYKSHRFMWTKYNHSKKELANYKRSILTSSGLTHLEAI